MATMTALRRRRWSPGPSAIVDRGHPLAQRLATFFVPAGGRFVDVAGSGLTLTSASAKTLTFVPSSFGVSLGHTSASSAGPDYVSGAIPSWMQSTVGSIMWAGKLHGGTGGATNGRLFGAQYNNVNGSPFSVLDMYRTDATTAIAAACDAGGALTETTMGAVGTTGDHVAVVTFDGANLVAWWNGLRVVNTAVAGSLTWTATSRFCVGDPSGTNQPGLNAGLTAGAFWNRALSQVEVAALVEDPFRMLIPPRRMFGAFHPAALFPLRTPSRQIRVRG